MGICAPQIVFKKILNANSIVYKTMKSGINDHHQKIESSKIKCNENIKMNFQIQHVHVSF